MCKKPVKIKIKIDSFFSYFRCPLLLSGQIHFTPPPLKIHNPGGRYNLAKYPHHCPRSSAPKEEWLICEILRLSFVTWVASPVKYYSLLVKNLTRSLSCELNGIKPSATAKRIFHDLPVISVTDRPQKLTYINVLTPWMPYLFPPYG